MTNIELAPQNPFSTPLEKTDTSRNQLDSGNQWESISEILAIAVLRNRFRRKQEAD